MMTTLTLATLALRVKGVSYTHLDDTFDVDADDPGIAAYSAEPEYIFVPHEHTDDCYQEVQELTLSLIHI